ncbi:hypothetical protein [Tenacibaculum sp. 190524A05c]|uniref:hypothetical protein n=1 Tax=Tenacibaculum platacis TaxID=3137852 RepID=UPI0031FB7D42
MGKGAFVTVENKGTALAKVYPGGDNCMNATGSWGNLIPAGKNSAREYIEAHASGIPCCCEASTIIYGVATLDPSTGQFTQVGTFSLREDDYVWSSQGATGPITVNCLPGEQYTITVTYNG